MIHLGKLLEKFPPLKKKKVLGLFGGASNDTEVKSISITYHKHHSHGGANVTVKAFNDNYNEVAVYIGDLSNRQIEELRYIISNHIMRD